MKPKCLDEIRLLREHGWLGPSEADELLAEMERLQAENERLPNLMVCPWCMGYFDSPDIHDPDACGIRQDKAQLADELAAALEKAEEHIRCMCPLRGCERHQSPTAHRRRQVLDRYDATKEPAK